MPGNQAGFMITVSATHKLNSCFMRMLQFPEQKNVTMIYKGLLTNRQIYKGNRFLFLQILTVFGKVKVCIHTPVAFEVCKLII